MTEPRRIELTDALALLSTDQAVLCDTRDPRLYENLHADRAISVPLARIESAESAAVIAALPRDRILLFYCA